MNLLKQTKRLAAAAVIVGAAACAPEQDASQAVAENYANIAQAMFEDSLTTAQNLQTAVGALIANPSDDTLEAARRAWISARVPYQQSEGLRFGNAIVDEWEGKVNAWPLDEGLIDYVDTSLYGEESDENPGYVANVVANEKFVMGDSEIDATVIDKALLADTLHEAQGVEANVATGYHAIEFLLWGQDLNGTNAGAGNRPASDFDVENCTGGNCDRRAAYLQAATGLLIDDLREMVNAWSEGGEARAAILSQDASGVYSSILTGIGSLSYGELAGERIKLGLLLHDPEEEHDCFSDNTHNSHYYDQVGMIALYQGSYTRVNGNVVSGPSVASVAGQLAADHAAEVDQLMAATLGKMDVMKAKADRGEMAYDQMIGEGNDSGNAIIMDVVNALVAQARGVERLVAALNLEIQVEGSDSLDNPSAI